MSNYNFIHEALEESKTVLEKTLNDSKILDQIKSSIECMVETYKNDGNILACGNGGSMCDSLHFTEELTGRYRKDRRPLGAISMDNPGHLSCVSNDYGFDHVFSRNVEGIGKAGDSLIAISTSGNSKNIIKAVEAAKNKKIKTIGLLGKDGGVLKELCDIPIIIDSQVTDKIQEMHIKLIHIFIEGIERELFPELYT